MILVWSNGAKLGKIIIQTLAIDDVRVERREKAKKPKMTMGITQKMNVGEEKKVDYKFAGFPCLEWHNPWLVSILIMYAGEDFIELTPDDIPEIEVVLKRLKAIEKDENARDKE